MKATDTGRRVTAALKPFPAYTDSGARWLGEVPEHWTVLPHRALFMEIKERDHPEEEMLSVTIMRGVIKQEALLQSGSKKDSSNEDKSAYKLVCPGDIAYNKMRAWQGAIGVSTFRGIVSPAYVVVRPRGENNPRYFHYLFRTPGFAKEAERWSYGITSDMWSLRPEHFRMICSCLPPLDEQIAIVRYLDHVGRRVRRYIRDKQRLIALLEQQKQAVAHSAITGQIDVRTGKPYSAYKDSHVMWLGNVPEHWSLKRLKFLVRLASGQVDPREPENRVKILVAPNHIRSGSGSITRLETAEDQGADSGKYEVGQGQVIYSKIRPNLRKAAIAPCDCLCSADMYPMTVRESELRPRYFVLLLLSEPFTRYAVDCSMRVAMPKVNREALGESWLWYPDLEEQDRILRFIDARAETINHAIERSKREVTLLREFQVRLATDVATGKLDVREVAAQLPEEDEAQGPDDDAPYLDNDEVGEVTEPGVLLVEVEA